MKERTKEKGGMERKEERACKAGKLYIYLFTFEEIKVDKYCLNDT